MVATRCCPTRVLQSDSGEIDELLSIVYNDVGTFVQLHRPLAARSAELNLDPVRLKPDEQAVQAELSTLRKRLERRPHSWVRLEGIGRCLRWLGDPEAEAYFLQAAANYKVKEGHSGDHMRRGNLHRLADDTEAAQRHFEQAHALYASRAYRENPNPLDVEHMIPASFLVGCDDEGAELIARLRAIDRDTDLICYAIARLAEARRTKSAELAADTVAELAAMIRCYRAKVWNTGDILPWDWYETAVETWRSLSEGHTE